MKRFVNYAQIKRNIEKGVYDKDKMNFLKKIFRIIYTQNGIGIYKEIFLFNKRIYCNLVCKYVY